MNIGLTQRVLYHRNRAYDSLEHSWYQFLDGHRLTFIPNTLDQDFERLADTIDCLIITGGDDSHIRRSTELKIGSIMMMHTKPILGVCHGAFMMTDVLGGLVEECSGHSDTEHTVNYHGREVTVNSYHNLAIRKVHSTARVLATDNDGNVEAWIDRVICGIVWHPERMASPFLPKEIQQVMKL